MCQRQDVGETTRHYDQWREERLREEMRTGLLELLWGQMGSRNQVCELGLEESTGLSADVPSNWVCGLGRAPGWRWQLEGTCSCGLIRTQCGGDKCSETGPLRLPPQILEPLDLPPTGWLLLQLKARHLSWGLSTE